MPATFSWSAELECVDLADLSGVVTTMHWRCTGALDGLDVAATGRVTLGPPSPDNFIPAPDGITSALIRSWVGADADGIEAALGEQLAAAATQPEVTRLFAPVTDLEAG